MKNKNFKNNKGITLIALVVTIIVLIILAGISINLILGENGIITKAQESKHVQEIAEIKSEIQLELMAKEAEVLKNENALTVAQIEAILGKYGTVNKNDDGTIKGLTPTDKDYEIPFREIYSGSLNSNTPVIPEGPTTNTAYTRGQEVTIGTETFYVLEDSDETKETVTLFAKYNLNKAGTAQAPNANCEDTACKFSSDNYWENEKLDVTPKFNLNEYAAVIEDTGSAVYKAKSYAKTVFPENTENVEGRLLTYEEAEALQTAITTDTTGKIAEMLWGQANTQEDGNYLEYWLGSANDSEIVYLESGYIKSVYFDYFYKDFYIDGFNGVRPVIEISKSAI